MKQLTPGKKMGQKPVHQVQAVTGYRSPQEAIWFAIRHFQAAEFTEDDLICRMLTINNSGTGINDLTVNSYLNRLERGGFIQVQRITQGGTIKGCAAIKHYRLINDIGIEAPRLTRQGKPSVSGLGNEQMWRAMKVLSVFDHNDLALAASTEAHPVKVLTAKSYCQHLYHAGYLAVVEPGGPNTPTKYRLLPSKNTGPRPPMVQRLKTVFDPNLNKVMYQEKAEWNQ